MRTIKYLSNAKSRTVTSSSAKFTAPLKLRTMYRLTVDVDTWFKFANENDTAAASADGATPLGAYDHIDLAVPEGGGVWLHVIRAAGVDGNANLAEIVELEVEP